VDVLAKSGMIKNHIDIQEPIVDTQAKVLEADITSVETLMVKDLPCGVTPLIPRKDGRCVTQNHLIVQGQVLDSRKIQFLVRKSNVILMLIIIITVLHTSKILKP